MYEHAEAFDHLRLRGILAERRISHKAFAAACGLNHAFLCHVLCGHRPGELARLKIDRGMRRLALRLDRELPDAS